MRKLGLALIFFAASTAANAERVEFFDAKRRASLTADHFAASAEFAGDDLDTAFSITTRPGLKEESGLLRVAWEDDFLVAVIDKKTGQISYALVVRVASQGSVGSFRSVNYLRAGIAEVAPVSIVNSEVTCPRWLGCVTIETVAIELSRSTLEEMAAAPSLWRFRLTSTNGYTVERAMLPAEAAGLLQALNAYQARKAPPVAAPSEKP